MNRFTRFAPFTTLHLYIQKIYTQKTVRTFSALRSVLCVLLMGGILSFEVLAQEQSHTTMNKLTVEVEHESGKDIQVQVGQAGELTEYVFTLAQIQDPQFIESQLADLEPAVLEAVKGALLRINRSEVLANSDSINEVDVEWVTESCNDTNADCEVIIKAQKHQHKLKPH